MKLSVSLPEDDVRFLDGYVGERGLNSRSAAVHEAVGLLRAADLETEYEAAWQEWAVAEDAALWDSTSGDGIA
ncbi:MAG: ribbon-helix-helix domain-containing protein [Candidatus Dormibacteria bacterium]|jgi:Arc/MetJ-type ribon-helix-helix transcriptional regulator